MKLEKGISQTADVLICSDMLNECNWKINRNKSLFTKINYLSLLAGKKKKKQYLFKLLLLLSAAIPLIEFEFLFFFEPRVSGEACVNIYNLEPIKMWHKW